MVQAVHLGFASFRHCVSKISERSGTKQFRFQTISPKHQNKFLFNLSSLELSWYEQNAYELPGRTMDALQPCSQEGPCFLLEAPEAGFHHLHFSQLSHVSNSNQVCPLGTAHLRAFIAGGCKLIHPSCTPKACRPCDQVGTQESAFPCNFRATFLSQQQNKA